MGRFGQPWPTRGAQITDPVYRNTLTVRLSWGTFIPRIPVRDKDLKTWSTMACGLHIVAGDKGQQPHHERGLIRTLYYGAFNMGAHMEDRFMKIVCSESKEWATVCNHIMLAYLFYVFLIFSEFRPSRWSQHFHEQMSIRRASDESFVLRSMPPGRLWSLAASARASCMSHHVTASSMFQVKLTGKTHQICIIHHNPVYLWNLAGTCSWLWHAWNHCTVYECLHCVPWTSLGDVR